MALPLTHSAVLVVFHGTLMFVLMFELFKNQKENVKKVLCIEEHLVKYSLLHAVKRRE